MKGYTRPYETTHGQVRSVKEPSLYQVVRYKGIFNLKELYKIIYSWLTSRGFEVQESKYKSINMGGGKRERTFNWFANRKVAEFVMLNISLHFQIQDVEDVEVIKDGKKKKLQKALLLIRIQHIVELDFNDRFARNKFHQSLISFMTKVLWRKKLDTLWEDKLRFKCYELMNVIKETLDFMTKGNEHYDVW